MKLTINGVEIYTENVDEAVGLVKAMSKLEEPKKVKLMTVRNFRDKKRWTKAEITVLLTNKQAPTNELRKLLPGRRSKAIRNAIHRVHQIERGAKENRSFTASYQEAKLALQTIPF